MTPSQWRKKNNNKTVEKNCDYRSGGNCYIVDSVSSLVNFEQYNDDDDMLMTSNEHCGLTIHRSRC